MLAPAELEPLPRIIIRCSFISRKILWFLFSFLADEWSIIFYQPLGSRYLPWNRKWRNSHLRWVLKLEFLQTRECNIKMSDSRQKTSISYILIPFHSRGKFELRICRMKIGDRPAARWQLSTLCRFPHRAIRIEIFSPFPSLLRGFSSHPLPYFSPPSLKQLREISFQHPQYHCAILY